MTSLPALAAVPWLLAPLALILRLRGAPSLDDVPAIPCLDPPLVSVIIPARNEARNIARCMQSVLDSDYPSLEVIVVNDRSEDGTAIIAREIAHRAARAHVIDAPPLPDGWFGKQWACAQGAAAAHGEILCFTDADTVHARDLLARAVNAMQDRALDLLSVAGRQELVSFWERVVQPHIFTILAARYGGPRAVNRSHRAVDKIANGQCLLFTRSAYDRIGGHAAVRAHAAEDLALAQLAYRSGARTELVLGLPQLATRMYTSLSELINGWMKNVYAAAIHAMPYGRLGRAILPVALLAFPTAMLVPIIVLILAAIGLAGTGALTWAALTTTILLLWWGTVYSGAARLSPLYALTFPLGATIVAYIMVRAVTRGRQVEWKGRIYRAE